MSLTFANKVTIGRILAVPFFIATVLYYSPERDYLRWVALGIFLFAGISDIVDGYVARRWHQKTQAGTLLDPLADKFLVISAYICLYIVGNRLPSVQFPLWLVVIVISRDVILVIGSALIYMLSGRLRVDVAKWGKIATFLQDVTIIGMLVQWHLSLALWYLTAGFTLVSGLNYIRNGIKIMNESPDSLEGEKTL